MKSLPILLLLTQLAYAQESVRLDEVVVTARKKAENLQEVPISTTSFNEEEITNSSIESIRGLVELTPNVTIVGSSSGRYITPYIRGQGNQDAQLPDEVSVAFYLDEVPLPRYAFDTELLDVARVDVMRGPQGTLFGKNTQAGAINIVTKDPSKEDGHKLSLQYGNLDQKGVSGVTNSEFFDGKLKNRFALKYKERGGWIKDTLQNRDLGDMDVFALSETLVYQPTQSLKYTFKLSLDDENGTDPLYVKKGTSDYPKTGQDILPRYQDDFYSSSLKIQKDFDSTRLTTITAASYHDFHVKYDEADQYIAAGLPLGANLNNPDVLYRDLQEYERLYYFESRLENTVGELDWTFGLSANHQNYRLNSFANTMRGMSLENIRQNVRLLGTNASLFGEVGKKISDKFKLSGGTRLIYDHKEFKSEHTSTQSSLPYYQQESQKDYANATGRVMLEYHHSENVMPYASLARGYQSGGFPSFNFPNYSAEARDQDAYGESSSLAYELGLKSEFLNKRIRTNVSVYFNDINDKQVRVRDPVSNMSGYQNVDTDVFGGEVETQAKVTQDISVGLSAGYTNAKFAERLVSGTSSTVVNHEGGRVANIPYWNGSAQVKYSRYFASLSGLVFARLAYKYTGSRFGDNDNRTKLGSYGLWDANLGYERERIGVNFYVQNMFDKVYESQGYYYSSLSTAVSSPGLPRLFGVNLNFYF